MKEKRLIMLWAVICLMSIMVATAVSAPAPTKPPSLSPKKNFTVAEIAKLPFGPERQRLLTEGSKKESVLNVYSGSRGPANIITPRFTNKYPWLKVNVYEADSAIVVERTLAEVHSGKLGGDFYMSGTAGIGPLRHLFQEFTSPNAVFDAFPEAAPVLINAIVYAYSKDRVAPGDVPRQLEDLLRPRWKGNMGALAPPNASAGYWTGMLLKLWGEEKTKTFLRAFGKQDLIFYNTGPMAPKGIVAGEFDLGMGLISSVYTTMKTDPRIDWVPLDLTALSPQYVAIFKEAKHPYATMLLLDWMLSTEGEAAGLESGGYASSREVKAGLVHGRKINKWVEPTVGDEKHFPEWNKLYRQLVMGK